MLVFSLIVGLIMSLLLHNLSSFRVEAAGSTQTQSQQWEFLKFDMSTEVVGAWLDGRYATLDEATTAANIQLMQFGLEGWELIDVEYYETGSGGNFTVNEVYFFKRPLTGQTQTQPQQSWPTQPIPTLSQGSAQG
jgi:hypothetical protein